MSRRLLNHVGHLSVLAHRITPSAAVHLLLLLRVLPIRPPVLTEPWQLRDGVLPGAIPPHAARAVAEDGEYDERDRDCSILFVTV